MPRSRRPLLGAAALMLGVAALAGAHDTWLLPASMRVPVGRPVRLSLTSGMTFPANDFAIAPARLARAEVRLAGAMRRLPHPSHGEQSLQYRWTPASPGVAALVVELAPKTLTLAPGLVEEYLTEIDASTAVRAQWARIAAQGRWRERYVKHAASFVRVGAACGDTSWRVPMGLGLELVPLADPTARRAGDSLPVRVLRGGVPLAGFAIGARPAGGAIAGFATTDARGVAAVPLPRAGRWLLAGTDLRRSEAVGLEWESDFATLTLAVRARDARPDCAP
jgi:hypothetical protein